MKSLQLACNYLLTVATGVWPISGQYPATNKWTGSTMTCLHTTVPEQNRKSLMMAKIHNALELFFKQCVYG